MKPRLIGKVCPWCQYDLRSIEALKPEDLVRCPECGKAETLRAILTGKTEKRSALNRRHWIYAASVPFGMVFFAALLQVHESTFPLSLLVLILTVPVAIILAFFLPLSFLLWKMSADSNDKAK